MSESDDTSSGYKRPPQGSRFQKGQSGNSKGRPKGSRNLKTAIEAIMNKRVAIRENGEPREVSGQDALLLSLFEKALRGDVKATIQFLTILMKTGAGDGPPSELDDDQDKDSEIFEDLIRRYARPNQGDQDS